MPALRPGPVRSVLSVAVGGGRGHRCEGNASHLFCEGLLSDMLAGMATQRRSGAEGYGRPSATRRPCAPWPTPAATRSSSGCRPAARRRPPSAPRWPACPPAPAATTCGCWPGTASSRRTPPTTRGSDGRERVWRAATPGWVSDPADGRRPAGDAGDRLDADPGDDGELGPAGARLRRPGRSGAGVARGGAVVQQHRGRHGRRARRHLPGTARRAAPLPALGARQPRRPARGCPRRARVHQDGSTTTRPGACRPTPTDRIED